MQNPMLKVTTCLKYPELKMKCFCSSIFTSLLTLVSGPWANPKAGAVELKMPVTGFDLGRNSSPNALNFLCCCW